MKLRAFLLADAVSLGEAGKIYVHGGGITRMTVESFPWTQPQLGVLLRLEREDEEIGSDHDVVIRVIQDDKVILAELTANYRVPRPDDEDFPLTMNVAGGFSGVVFPKPGLYAVSAIIDGEEISRLPLSLGSLEPSADVKGG